jgi:hypothetical protein
VGKLFYTASLEVVPMFDSLDEQMKNDDKKVSSGKERALKWVLVFVISVVVFGGLYFGVHLMEGS